MHALGLALVLVIRAYDMTGVTPKEMAHAERAVVDVLARAQIDVSWKVCRTTADTPERVCGDVPRPAEMILRIVSSPARPATAALAEAYVGPGTATGSFATVYIDRVRTLADASGVDAGTLMGRAVAHEIGHLLLGAASHSRSGVMRPVWSAPVLRLAGARAWTFSDGEAARLRANLRERFEPAIDERMALAEPWPSPRPCQRVGVVACARDER